MDTIVPPNSTQEVRAQKRQRKENGKRQKAQNKKDAVVQLATLLGKQVLTNALEIRELQTCVIRVVILSKHSAMAVSIKSAYEEFGARFLSASKEEQQNIVSPSAAAWIGLVRSTLSATLPEQVQTGLRAHRDGTNMIELKDGVKLVKTRKAWDENTVKMLLCVGPSLHSQLVFLSAATERRVEENPNTWCGFLEWVGEQHPGTLGDF